MRTGRLGCAAFLQFKGKNEWEVKTDEWTSLSVVGALQSLRLPLIALPIILRPYRKKRVAPAHPCHYYFLTRKRKRKPDLLATPAAADHKFNHKLFLAKSQTCLCLACKPNCDADLADAIGFHSLLATFSAFLTLKASFLCSACLTLFRINLDLQKLRLCSHFVPE